MPHATKAKTSAQALNRVITPLEAVTPICTTHTFGRDRNGLPTDVSKRRSGHVESMKAIIHRKYGGPEVLQLVELARPKPGPGQVLVKVQATSINAADYRMMRADPFLVRLANGLFRPTKRRVLGSDAAGVVVELGAGVHDFRIGDEVYGGTALDAEGAFAEFALVRAHSLAKKPAGLTFQQAAAVPLAGTTALQALREVAAGSRVLIAGAGGGVGLFAVQIARVLGAHVTAVCGPRSVELVRSLGAHEVIDYSTRDFTCMGQTWDTIVAVNGYQPLSTYRRHLAAKGRYVMVGGSSAQLFEALLLARPYFALEGKRGGTLSFDARRQAEDLQQLARWLESGGLRVIIDQQFALERAAEAMAHVERGHVLGKVILNIC